MEIDIKEQSIEVAQCSQLMVFAKYVHRDSFEEEFIFVMHWRLRQKQTTLWPSSSVSLKRLSFLGTNLLVYVPTELLPTELLHITQVKQRNPEVIGTHCMIKL